MCSLFIGPSLHKGAGDIATTQTIVYKVFQEDTGLGPGPSRLTPGARLQSKRQLSSQCQYLLWPRLSGPSPKIKALNTAGSLLCKHEGLDEWNLKWLQLGPRVRFENLLWVKRLPSLFAGGSPFILKLAEPHLLAARRRLWQAFDKTTLPRREDRG